MSTQLNEIKPKREISKNIIKQKFKNENWNLDLMPYIGKEFIKHSQKNNKPYNKIRNILILDLGLEEKFKTVNDHRTKPSLSLRMHVPYAPLPMERVLRAFRTLAPKPQRKRFATTW